MVPVPPAAVAPAHGYVHTAGIDVYYELHGKGTPLVLVPGAGSTVQVSFSRVIPELAREHRIIGVETQGEGHTRDRDAPLTFERDADDVAAVLEKLGVTNADVLGFSNGGNVALDLAIRHPKLVRRLVLASAFVRRDALPESFFDGMRTATTDSMPAALREAYERVAPDPAHLPVLVHKLSGRMLDATDIPREQLRNVTIPVLLVFADRDVYRPESFAQMFEQFDNARLAVFPNSLHGQYMGEQSTPGPYPNIPAFLSTVSDFLR
jgi:pimeloyl-ACP methyl ester carboxylesterase